MGEDMSLQAVRAAGQMVAPGPSALENARARLLPRRRKRVVGSVVGIPLNIGKLLDIARDSRQLGRLVEDRAAKYLAPLEGDG